MINDDFEKKGETHSVTRVQVESTSPRDQRVIGRRPFDIAEFVSDDTDHDPGEPSNEQTTEQLNVLADEYTERFLKDAEAKGEVVTEFNEKTIEAVARFVNSHFVFLNQGTGISTIPKQLEHFAQYYSATQNEQDPTARENARLKLSEGIDCKLPTVMVGFILRRLAEKFHNGSKISHYSTSNGPHPTLLINLGTADSSRFFIVDFRTKIPDEKTTPEFDSREEKRRWVRLHSLSTFNARLLTEYADEALEKPFITHRSLDLLGLQQLDEAFIKS